MNTNRVILANFFVIPASYSVIPVQAGNHFSHYSDGPRLEGRGDVIGSRGDDSEVLV